MLWAMQITTARGKVRIDGVYFVPEHAATAAHRWSLWIVRGDNGALWTVKPRDAARLEAAGYTILGN